MHREVHNCSQGVSIKNYEPRIEKSNWSIQMVVVELWLKLCTYESEKHTIFLPLLIFVHALSIKTMQSFQMKTHTAVIARIDVKFLGYLCREQ